MATNIAEEPVALRGPLFHYTSFDTLRAIVQTKKIWASHIAYMNDSSELDYGFRLLSAQIRAQMEGARGADRELLAALLAQTDTQPPVIAPTFAICFSEDPNLLSQWQAYTPHGSGVAIGFHHVALIERVTRAGWHWMRCAYDLTSQNEWMAAILTRVKREAAEHLSAMPAWQAVAKALTDARSDLFACAATVKHPAFEPEKEWRLVSPPIELTDPRVKFRAGKTTLIPYVEFELCDDAIPIPQIPSTWVGPAASASHAHTAISAMLTQAGVRYPYEITSSMIPYREI